MNKKDINWVDLTEPNEQERKFVSLIEEGNTHGENINQEDRPKSQVLFETLWGLMHKQAICEANARDEGWGQFKERNTWKNFCEQAKVIAVMLGATSTQLEQAIQKLENVFESIGNASSKEKGETAIEKGFQKMEVVKKNMKAAQLDLLSPELNSESIIQLISGEPEMVNSYNNLLDMIIARNNHKIANLLKRKNASDLSFGELLKPIFKTEQELEVFRKIVNSPYGYKKKSGGDIGKGEIALAMFFGDCKFPEDKGDIRFGNENVEVKGQNGTIGLRSGEKAWLPIRQWKDCQKDSGLSSWSVVLKTIGGEDKNRANNLQKALNAQAKKINTNSIQGDVLNNISNAYNTSSTSTTQWVASVKFIVLFSLWLNQYVKTDQIDRIWVMNTTKTEGRLDKLFTSKFVQIITSEIKGDCGFATLYDFGYNTLEFLRRNNINVRWATRESGAANDKGYSFKLYCTVNSF